MPMKYLKNNINLLKESFKSFDAKVIFIVLYDLIFYSSFLFLIFLFSRILQNRAIELQKIPMDNIMQLPQEELKRIVSHTEGLLLTIILGLIIFFILLFIAMCIFKGLIWIKTLDKRPTKDFLIKFTVLNLLWFSAWIIPFFILSLLLKKGLIAPLVIILFFSLIHFTAVLYASFAEKAHKKTTFKELYLKYIKQAFKLGTTKFHLFIIPYIILFFIFMISMQLYWLYSFTSENIQSIITILIMITFFAWYRIYFSKIVKSII